MPEIRLSARCYPTEDSDKVRRAIKGLFPDAALEGEDPVTGVATSLENFAELLKRQRIRDAARRIMRRGLSEGSTSFNLNKQVATLGKISFAEEAHPLGDIEVRITAEDIEALIDSIAPSTRVEVVR